MSDIELFKRIGPSLVPRNHQRSIVKLRILAGNFGAVCGQFEIDGGLFDQRSKQILHGMLGRVGLPHVGSQQ